MERTHNPSGNAWSKLNFGNNVNGEPSPRPGASAGAGRGWSSADKSSSGPGAQATNSRVGEQQRKGSFGGSGTNTSRLSSSVPVFQFGDLPPTTVTYVKAGPSGVPKLPENHDPVRPAQASAVPKSAREQQHKPLHENTSPVLLKSAAVEPQAPAKAVPEVVNTPPPAKTVQTPQLAPRGSSNNSGSSSSHSATEPSFLSNEEDFPALGASVSMKPRPASKSQPWKPTYQAPEPTKGAVINSVVVDEVSNMGVKKQFDHSGAERRCRERDEQNKFMQSRGGGNNNWRESADDDPIGSLGRTLTKILRHQAMELKINIRSDGYAEVRELLNLPMKTRSGRPLSSYTVEDVLQAVQQDDKQRFGTKEENGLLLIRASQGHTIKTIESEHLLMPITSAEETPVCVHGTYRRNLSSILKEGLKRMSRNHVHFASGLTRGEGAISGMRKTSEILIYLDVNKALEDGMKLYISDNGVILTDGFEGVVPPKYFKDVLTWPDKKPIHIN